MKLEVLLVGTSGSARLTTLRERDLEYFYFEIVEVYFADYTVLYRNPTVLLAPNMTGITVKTELNVVFPRKQFTG